MRVASFALASLMVMIVVVLRGADLAHPRFGFPVYSNQQSGRQLSGQHAPASTPALSPDDAQRKFTVPDGYQMRLFASEPEVVNPVAMSWDDRGRLWVLELYEYPLGTKPGVKGRDRIKILEDIDGDGRVDTVKVFADGFSLATGLLVGNGGVYVGEAPNLWFLEDTNGDDIADKKTAVLTGFGLEDRHELLNGFTWGPDGRMYMTHGVFTRSSVMDPDEKLADARPTVLTAGVARFEPASRRFEVFAEGTSNPWGVDFDAKGNAFVSACVIDHLFHLIPGGIYARQAGQPPFPYAYELLPSIVDHKHHMAAYAGVCVYEGDQFPADVRGAVLMGNIHDNAIHWDRLTPNGSTFKASFVRDLVRANDGWFMPVSTQVGPDGAVWIMDWYDRYPCYQNANADPDGVDRERGRIWRLVHVGANPGKNVPSRPPGLNLGAGSSEDLVKALAHPNVWHRRMAQRILNGRKDPATRDRLLKSLRETPSTDGRLTAFWTLFSSGLGTEAILDEGSLSRDAAIRAWAMHLTGDKREYSVEAMKRLDHASRDSDPGVRLAVVSAIRCFLSGSLTIDTPPPATANSAMVGQLLPAVVEANRDTDDPLIPFMIWMAAEPLVAPRAGNILQWFAEQGISNQPLAGRILNRILRRICDERSSRQLDLAVKFLEKLPESSASLTLAALDGLLEGQRGKAVVPAAPTQPFLDKLLASTNKEIVVRAQQLGTLWGDAAALQATLSRIGDAKAAEADRLEAIRVVRQTKTEDVRNVLAAAAVSSAPDNIRVEAIRALGEAGNDASTSSLLAAWSVLGITPRRATAELLASRPAWTALLLKAIDGGRVGRSDVPTTVIRNLISSKNDAVRRQAQRVFGRIQETPEDKLKLIAEKRKMVIDGPVDLAAGRQIAQKTCLVCHKLHGGNAEVGPDLTGVGRSSLDALLHNVIHPNEIIGQGYENVVLELRDGRTLTGRMIESNDVRIRLLLAGPQEEVIARSDVKSVVVSDNSAMPEGLEQIPDEDFRNLIWYILAPPEDGKPLTPERRKEFIGSLDSATVSAPADGESIALWNPPWRVDCPVMEGVPAKLPEMKGWRNVLVTHPFDRSRPATLERDVDVAPAGRTHFRCAVAAHPHGGWEFRILADGKVLQTHTVEGSTDKWQAISVDLSKLAGRKVRLRLENGPGNAGDSFGYWAGLEIHSGDAVIPR
ncbi:MAG: dehydrogenase [Pedosphaera sp.]|nr:dehydrogenase [Pedosphaera sp.]